METIVNQIRTEESRKTALVAELAGLSAADEVARLDGATIGRELKDAAADVKALLAGTTAQARQMLRKILDGKKLDAEPVEHDGRRGYRLSGELCVGRLLPTDVFRAVESSITSKTVVAPRGLDTFWNVQVRGTIRAA